MGWIPWRRGGGGESSASKEEFAREDIEASTSDDSSDEEVRDEGPKTWQERLERYKYEEKYRPEYRYDSDVEEEMFSTGMFKKKELTDPAEIAENERKIEEVKNSPMVKFLLRVEELKEQELAAERLRNNTPPRKDDTKLWRSLPFVPGPDGGPGMPRLALKTEEEVQKRFWDFFKEFGFGLWGYKQRPYPNTRPCDVQQALGYNWLDKRYSDFAMRSGSWYYKDRLGRTRGPMELVNMKTAWAGGIIDKNTFIWGEDMDEWAPIGMVYGLQTAIVTPDIKWTTAGTSLVHKLSHGVPLWRPKKGHEFKSYKQLQAEAIEKRERENAVLRRSGGAWPGERSPSFTHFLWASGSDLTNMLEDDKSGRFISYETRKRLAKEIPGLRPWEVQDVEQVMDLVTFNKQWYREDLGDFTTRADYERDWFETFQEKWDEIAEDIESVFGRGDDDQTDQK
ncbi:hypothetical protein R1sor_000027 [Riccia sorocarpa]|uniref:GYF domain-containing protein n=1 Tax=Riccia sorocarpa TaxID=122646 RepID=A0ABD3GRX2_9MARC